jgi:hypothetical protein
VCVCVCLCVRVFVFDSGLLPHRVRDFFLIGSVTWRILIREYSVYILGKHSTWYGRGLGTRPDYFARSSWRLFLGLVLELFLELILRWRRSSWRLCSELFLGLIVGLFLQWLRTGGCEAWQCYCAGGKIVLGLCLGLFLGLFLRTVVCDAVC